MWLFSALAFCTAVTAAPGPAEWLSAVRSGDGTCCDVVPGAVDGAVAVGAYTAAVNQTGWAVVDIASAKGASVADAGLAAGILEGYASHEVMYDAFQNFVAFFFKGTNRTVANGCVLAFVEQQLAWLEEHTASGCPGGNCTYWQNVNASLWQARGLWVGYNKAAPSNRQLAFHEVYQLTNAGDLEDLLSAFPDKSCPGHSSDWEAALATARVTSAWHQPLPSHAAAVPMEALQDASDVPPAVRAEMSCSGFLRLARQSASEPQLLSGHTTFNAYEFMLRAYKIYRMPLPGVAATVASFSARPGDLESKDDWYVLDSGLTVMETSLTVFDKALYKNLSPLTAPCWLRVSVANRLAASAEQWAQVFRMHASGTHNNDWIVGDWSALGRDGFQGAAWRLEEMPGTVVAWDATPALVQDGFLFSVNIPNNSVIFNISGYNRTGFSLETDPRANIFRRDGLAVVDGQSLQTLMTSNRYTSDPLSKGNPCNAISARCDLPGANGTKHQPFAFGGIDCKLADNARMKPKPQGPTARVQSSPTFSDGIPEFRFDPEWASVPHEGMPDAWPFAFEELTSQTSGLPKP